MCCVLKVCHEVCVNTGSGGGADYHPLEVYHVHSPPRTICIPTGCSGGGAIASSSGVTHQGEGEGWGFDVPLCVFYEVLNAMVLFREHSV